MPVQQREGPGATEASPLPRSVAGFFAVLRRVFGKAEDERHAVNSGTWRLCVSVEADELDGGFVAECLDVPGAMSQGETEREALENLIDAIQGVLAVRMEERFRTIDFDMPSATPHFVSVPL
jgi:predicted RNase H-like HicB family nuclease